VRKLRWPEWGGSQVPIARLKRRPGGILESLNTFHRFLAAEATANEDAPDAVAVSRAEVTLRRLSSDAGTNDPNSELIAWTLGQLLLSAFKESLKPDVGREAVRLLSQRDGDWIDQPFRLYELARAHYEVGRRLEDLVLLERAAAFYRAAAENGRPWSLWARRTRKNAEEAQVVAQHLMTRKLAPHGRPAVPALVMVPMISMTFEHDCVEVRNRLGKSQPNYFHAVVADADCLVRFLPSNEDFRDPLLSPPADPEHRGRSVLGPVQFAITLSGQRSNIAVLEFRLPGTAPEAEQFFRENFDAVEQWGIRLSKWLDVLFPQAPLGGVTNVTQCLNVQVGGRRSRQVLRVVAPDAKSHVVLNSLGLDRPGRADVQLVISELSMIEMPLALDFIRRARATMSAGDVLRALMECGTAAEAALAAQYDLLSPTLHEARWTLGTLVRMTSKLAGALPASLTQHQLDVGLVQVRNRAVHSGRAALDEAERALELAESVVDHIYRCDSGQIVELRDQLLLLHD
jgi:hypothetical protein